MSTPLWGFYYTSSSMWKYHSWRLPWRIAVYSLNAGYIPVEIYLCPFRCFLGWFVDPLGSCTVLDVHWAHTHAYAYISIYVWFSISGFCQVKCGYSHTLLHVPLVVPSTAGSCRCICFAVVPDLGWGTLREMARPLVAGIPAHCC